MGERQKSKMQGLIHFVLVLQPGSRRHPSAAGDPEIAEKAARKTALVAEHCFWHEENLADRELLLREGQLDWVCRREVFPA